MNALAVIAYPLWMYVAATAAMPLWLLAVRKAVRDPTTSPVTRSYLGALMHICAVCFALLDRGLPREAATVLVTLHVIATLFYVTLAKRYAMERDGD